MYFHYILVLILSFKNGFISQYNSRVELFAINIERSRVFGYYLPLPVIHFSLYGYGFEAFFIEV